MSQTRKMSFVESLANVAVGYGISVTAVAIIFPLFGIAVPLRDNLIIGVVFTVISVLRSYALRRTFNWIHTQGNSGISPSR